VHGTASRGRLLLAGGAVVLLAWLVPSPLPWTSPLQAGATRTPAQQLGLAIGGGAVVEVEKPLPSQAPAPKPAPTSPVPAAFHGQWRGTGTNYLGGKEFTAVVTFPASPQGQVIATADFPTYGCQEVWQLRKRAAQVIDARATVSSGPCVVRPLDVQVRLVGPRRLYVQWRLLDGGIESEAQLAKV
jgi:hypothetical protein